MFLTFSIAEYCADNEQIFNYTNQIGIEVTDDSGNDISGVLKGSPQTYISFIPGPTSTITIDETQPGENTLMAIPPFTVINARNVTVTIEGPNGETFVTSELVSSGSGSCYLSQNVLPTFGIKVYKGPCQGGCHVCLDLLFELIFLSQSLLYDSVCISNQIMTIA